jgi:hypothetical protein
LFVSPGSHNLEKEGSNSYTANLTFFAVNKQINDKERTFAAMENPNLKKIVDDCIRVEY